MKIKRLFLLLLLVVSIVSVTLVSALQIGSFYQKTEALLQTNLLHSTVQQTDSFERFFEQRSIQMRLTAQLPQISRLLSETPENVDAQNRREVADILYHKAKELDFLNEIILMNENGRILSSSEESNVGAIFPITPEMKALSPYASMYTDLSEDARFQNGRNCCFHLVAINDGGQRLGYVAEVLSRSYFDELIQTVDFSHSGAVSLLDRKGNVVASSDSSLHQSLFEAIQEENVWAQEGAKANSSGILQYKVAGGKMITAYSGIAGTGWMLFYTLSVEDFISPAQQAAFTALIFLAVLVVLLILSSFALSFWFNKPIKRFVETMHQVEEGDYSVHLQAKPNTEFAQIADAFNSLIDTVRARNLALSRSEQHYRQALKASSDTIFQADLTHNRFSIETDAENDRDIPSFLSSFSEVIEYIAANHVFPEDRKVFYDTFSISNILHRFRQGEKEITVEYRRYHKDRRLCWTSCTIVPMQSCEVDEAVVVIGYLKNINERKVRELKMLDQSKRDSLTKFLNKGAVQEAVDECLKGPGKEDVHAFLIIDIDNFKAINDNLGHLFGDAVLRDTAAKLQALLRPCDLIGRIGGDEFVVFLKGYPSKDWVMDQAKEITGIFRKDFTGHSRRYKISGSVGIALYPDDGQSYTDLMKQADVALYHAKSLGKDQFCLFDSTLLTKEFLAVRDSAAKAHDEVLPLAEPEALKQNLVQYIFALLYDAKDRVSAIEMILDLVGEYFDVSRAYIFETDEQDPTLCHNTFEWCKEGVAPQIENLRTVSYELFSDYRAYFDEDGILYFDDVSTLEPGLRRFLQEGQGIQSMLQCAIREDGEFKGFVGFDDCEKKLLATREEVMTLSLVSKLLGTFLMQEKAQNRLHRSFAMNQTIMDHLSTWTYVIDFESHRLLFLNKKTQRISPDSKVGDRCYESFYHRDTPCERCPLSQIDPSDLDSSCTMELYNPVLKVWTAATASIMEWNNGKSVCLMCCCDVTRYKESF